MDTINLSHGNLDQEPQDTNLNVPIKHSILGLDVAIGAEVACCIVAGRSL